jgi:hypothetical protein
MRIEQRGNLSDKEREQLKVSMEDELRFLHE